MTAFLLWSTNGSTISAGERFDEDGYILDEPYAVNGQIFYTICDINDDQINELIVAEGPMDASGNLDGNILDIFTLNQGQPVWIAAGFYRNDIYVCKGGLIGQIHYGGAKSVYYEFGKSENAALITTETEEQDGETYLINGHPCEEAEFQAAIDLREHVPLSDFTWTALSDAASSGNQAN